MRRDAALCVALGLLLPTAADAATARVQYVSASYAYLDAGSDAGMAAGDSVSVARGDTLLRLGVAFVAAHSAACVLPAAPPSPRAGDVVTFEPHLPASAPRDTAGVSVTPRPRGAWAPPARWRGAIAAGVFDARDSLGSARSVTMSADLRRTTARGDEFAVRVRGTRPSWSRGTDVALGAAPPTAATRVRVASLRYRPAGSGIGVEAGRMLPACLEALGTLDGGGVSVRAGAVTVGAAGGRAADIRVIGEGGGGTAAGGFLEIAAARGTLLLAGGTRADSTFTRRRFVTVRTAQTWRPSVHLAQSIDVDFAPAWQKSLGQPATSLTAWSLSGDAALSRRVSIGAAVDMRRTLPTPELATLGIVPVLDRGTGARLSCRIALPGGAALRLAGSDRGRSGDSTHTRSGDVTLSLARLAGRTLAGSVHALTYDGPAAHGTLADALLAARVTEAVRLEASAGLADTQDPLARTATLHERWFGGAAMLELPGGLWADLRYRARDQHNGHDLTLDAGVRF